MLSIDHIQTAAPLGCETAACRFFVAQLRLSEPPKVGPSAASGGVGLHTGSAELHVGVRSAFTPAKKAHVALRTTSIEERHAPAKSLAEASCDVNGDTRLLGIERFLTNHLWGNQMELMCSH